MATKITQDIEKQINELYYKCKVYAQVARELGISPSTVKKYVRPNYVPAAAIEYIRISTEDVPEFTTAAFEGIKNWGDLCILSAAEVNEMEKLWKEIQL